MNLITRLLITGFTLFIFLYYLIDDDKVNFVDSILLNKLYIFLFVFIIEFILNIFHKIYMNSSTTTTEIVDISINDGLLSVIAFDIYKDMILQGKYEGYSKSLRSLVLVLLIIAFITSINILQMLFTKN
jgi:hypothetical protein